MATIQRCQPDQCFMICLIHLSTSDKVTQSNSIAIKIITRLFNGNTTLNSYFPFHGEFSSLIFQRIESRVTLDSGSFLHSIFESCLQVIASQDEWHQCDLSTQTMRTKLDSNLSLLFCKFNQTNCDHPCAPQLWSFCWHFHRPKALRGGVTVELVSKPGDVRPCPGRTTSRCPGI